MSPEPPYKSTLQYIELLYRLSMPKESFDYQSHSGLTLDQLRAARSLDLSEKNIRSRELSIILKEALQAENLSLESCQCLSLDNERISLALNSLPQLKTLNLRSCEISIANLITLLNAITPGVSVVISPDFYEKIKVELLCSDTLKKAWSRVQTIYVQNNKIQPNLNFYDFIPIHKKTFSFQFRGINKTKNQGMIIEKLSQYWTLTKKNTALIPEIQAGICIALSCLFKDHPVLFEQMLERLKLWDGKADTLSVQLKTDFKKLLHYINQYQLQQAQKIQYLGDHLESFLNQCQTPCTLESSWHCIAIEPPLQKGGKWGFYDPNCMDGPARNRYTKKELLQKIKQSLGACVSVAGTKKKIPFDPRAIQDRNLFIEQGGLLCLLERSADCGHMLRYVKQQTDFSLQALDGLLLRSTVGTPSWAHGLAKGGALASFTLTLLQQFILKNPENYLEKLRYSISASQLDEQKKYMTYIAKKTAHMVKKDHRFIAIQIQLKAAIFQIQTDSRNEKALQAQTKEKSPIILWILKVIRLLKAVTSRARSKDQVARKQQTFKTKSDTLIFRPHGRAGAKQEPKSGLNDTQTGASRNGEKES